MAIDQKPSKEKPAEQKPLTFRDNPEVKKRIEAYKSANPQDVLYYTRLVKEYPERAIDTLIYKEVQKHDNEMKLIEKQLPAAKAFYEAQNPEAKARIDGELEGVKPMYRDKQFVNAVFRESDRQTRREFANPGTAAKNGTKPVSPKVAA